MNKIEGSTGQGVVGATIGFFIGFAAVALFGLTATKIKDLMSLSPLMLGFLVAAPLFSGSLLRIPFSAWVDTTGGRKPFLVLLSLSIIGMLGLYVVIHLFYPDNMKRELYPLLLFLGTLCGCGIATFSVGIGQVSYWFPQNHQGKVLGIYAGVGNLAPGIFSLILPFALKAWDLAGAYLAWLVFLILGTCVYWLCGRNAWYFQLLKRGIPADQARKIAQEKYGQEIFPKGNFIESLKLSAGRWKNWVFVAIYFVTFGGFIALTAWFPMYWKSFFSMTTVTSGVLTASYSILTSLTRVVSGSFSDKFTGEKLLMITLVIMLIGSILMFNSRSVINSVVAILLLAIGMGGANAAVFKLVVQEIPNAVGGAAGWVGGLGAFGGFVIPPVLSFFVRQQGQAGYANGFIVFIILTFISLVLAYILMQTCIHKKGTMYV